MLTQKNITSMRAAFTLPALPYAPDALEPVISRETMEFHHGKHLQAYVNTLNTLVKGTEYEMSDLEEIVCKAPAGPLFDNAGQVLNHTLYFTQFTTPGQGSLPQGRLAELIVRDFGSLDQLKRQMEEAAIGLFGSGWAWLSLSPEGRLLITRENNAGNPLRKGNKPLLCIDVWEHAYYIDYRNRRADHVKQLWEIIDWQAVADRL